MNRAPTGGTIAVELPVPVEIVDGGWIVAVLIDARRPDVSNSAFAIPVIVPDLDGWHGGLARRGTHAHA